jgi:hypothetical protein
MPISRIKTDGIQDDAVTSAKIGVDVIVADDLAANSVTVSEITNGAVTSAKLDTNIAIAGNLTVDTNTLYVDSTNNRVGIGTTPTSIFHTEENTTGASIVRHKNTSNTSGAHSRLIIQNGGTSGGDTIINLDSQTSGSRFTLGVDNSANKFVIANADKGSFDGSDEAFVITSGGNVGISTDSPSVKLHIKGSLNSGGIFVEDDNSSTAGPAVVVTGKRSDGNGSQAFSGKLLLSKHHTGGAVDGAGDTLGTIMFGGNHTDDSASNILYSSSISGISEGTFSDSSTMPSGIAFYTGSTGRSGDQANVSTGTERMRIDSNGNLQVSTGQFTVGTTATTGLQFINDGTFGTLHSEDLKFRTNSTDRMRVDASGHILLANKTAIPTTNGGTGFDPDTNGRMTLHIGSASTAAQGLIYFKNGNGEVGSIVTSGTSTAYNTSSDHRLKENVTYDFDATTRLKQLKPCRFNFIADPNTTVDGFLAHEVTAVPEAVSGEKDATQPIGNITDADGNILEENVKEPFETVDGQTWTATGTEPVYQGIDQSKLVPLLVKTIQELEARITALESN